MFIQFLKKEFSQENIFKPLGMTSTSFYLTPELKAKAIDMTFPADAKLEPFVDQTKLIEREPSRGKRLFLLIFILSFFTTLFAKWNFIWAASGSTVPWKTISLSYAIFFKSNVNFHIGFITIPSSFKFSSTAGNLPPNPIVSVKTVQEIFTPSLPPPGATSLDRLLIFFGEPAGNQWGTALALRTEDVPERHKKGSAYCKLFCWAGSTNYVILLL